MYRTLETERIHHHLTSTHTASHHVLLPYPSPVIILKHVLCSVSMVNVPVQDEDSQWCMGDFLGIASSERSGVEEAETTGRVSLCVMTWRSDDGHTIVYLQTDQITSSSRTPTPPSHFILVHPHAGVPVCLRLFRPKGSGLPVLSGCSPLCWSSSQQPTGQTWSFGCWCRWTWTLSPVCADLWASSLLWLSSSQCAARCTHTNKY